MSKLYIGESEITKLMCGESDYSLYVGETKLYPTDSGGGGDTPTDVYDGLCFTATSDGSVSLVGCGMPDAYTGKTFYYSYDGLMWDDYSVDSVVYVSEGDKIYMKSDDDLSLADSTELYLFFELSGSFKVSGKVTSLLNDTTDTLPEYAFYNLFIDCTQITSAPELPSLKLSTYCYSGMFLGCTNLTEAPELPATSLATYCYSGMFYNCKSLKSAFKLPATKLYDHCYNGMFNACTALTQAPELPATNANTYCYSYMFYGCTSLVNAPELKLDTLSNYCCQYMFSGCTSLTQAPELLAPTLKTACYQYMFLNCTSLVNAPVLKATTLVSNCYKYMFNGCKALNWIEAWFTTTPNFAFCNAWVTNVKSSGVFVKVIGATWTTTGTSAVPSDWTVIYTDGSKYYTSTAKTTECDKYGTPIQSEEEAGGDSL